MTADSKGRDLVYYMHDGAEAFRFQLAGDLSGHSTRDLEQARLTASSVFRQRRLIVDLTDITSIDVDGSQLLQEWHARGAELVVISANAKTRIQSMTNTPITIVAAKNESYKWLLRPATLFLATLLVALLLATAITATSCWPLFLGAGTPAATRQSSSVTLSETPQIATLAGLLNFRTGNVRRNFRDSTSPESPGDTKTGEEPAADRGSDG